MALNDNYIVRCETEQKERFVKVCEFYGLDYSDKIRDLVEEFTTTHEAIIEEQMKGGVKHDGTNEETTSGIKKD